MKRFTAGVKNFKNVTCLSWIWIGGYRVGFQESTIDGRLADNGRLQSDIFDNWKRLSGMLVCLLLVVNCILVCVRVFSSHR